jgi:L-ribulose-5-phosphate 3-epimerase
MQGRLSPPAGGRIQSFPHDSWRDEFHRARLADVGCIEWIFEHGDYPNPLSTDDGLEEIRHLALQTGVEVSSVCADYYMDRQLISETGQGEHDQLTHLNWLIDRTARLGAKHIVVPFVDRSSIRTPARAAGVVNAMRMAGDRAGAAGITLHLETDLPPQVFGDLLAAIGSSAVQVTHDIGNSAALGYDPVLELTILAPWLGSIHVKDRKQNGPSVPLGTGAADLPACFSSLAAAGFSGPLILQTARGTDGDEVAWTRRNVDMVKRHLAHAFEVDGPRA